MTTSKPTADPDDYDDFYDDDKDVTTVRPKKEKPTDDEDLFEGSGQEGSGREVEEHYGKIMRNTM